MPRMGRSVFALILGLMLVMFSGAAYAYVRLTMTDDSSTESGADSGVAACQALLAQPTGTIDDELDATIIEGLKGSDNADLQAAGETIERFVALPPEQKVTAAAELVAAMGQITTGCEAVGVSLIPETSGSPSPGATSPAA